MMISKACLNQTTSLAGKNGHAYNNRGPEWYHNFAARTMADIDALPKAWRLLVHEHGWFPVRKWYKEFRGNVLKCQNHIMKERLAEIDPITVMIDIDI